VPNLSVLGSSLVILLLIAFMLWFALGTQHNIRKGNSILTWLQAGLPQLGRRTALRWLGSSAVRLNIVDPKAPFREAEVVVVLEPRDVGFLWAWARSRNRRDFIILRGELKRSPAYEVEAGNPAGWTGGDRLRKLDPEAWERTAWEDRNAGVAYSPGADVEGVRRNWEDLEQASGGVWRLSVRQASPHLEVHVLLPDRERVGADVLLQAFRSLAATVTPR
jgi:hypothetical protein